MYTMIGGDGREYGPVDAGQIGQWVADGRANGQTKIRVENAAVWVPLSSIPELAAVLPSSTPSIPPLTSPIPTREGGVEAWADAMAERDTSLDVGACFSDGFQFLFSNLALFLPAAFIGFSAVFFAQMVPLLGLIVGPAIYGIVYGGLYVVYLRRIRGEPTNVGEVFSGFGPQSLHLMVTGIIAGFLTSVGLVFFILPGIYLWVIWAFPLALVLDKRLPFWPALELSRRVASRHWFGIFAVLFVTHIPVIVYGGYTCMHLVEEFMKIFQAGFSVEKLNKLAETATPMALTQEMITMITLPYVCSVLMCAYHQLFDTK
jgi:hypothetical protein